MPHTELLKITGDDPPLLEGVGVMVLGRTILAGNTQNPCVVSNESGFNWLKNLIDDEYEVVWVPLISSVMHLDYVLSVLCNVLAVVCEEAFVDGLPKQLEGHGLIKVSL